MRMLYLLVIFFCVITLSPAMEVVYMDNWCDQTFYISGSPNYRVQLTSSTTYKANWECTFTVTGDYIWEDRLMIDFRDLSVEYSSDCQNDWLSLHDGDSVYADTIGESKFCGQDTPSYIYTTSGDSITFYFKSDDTVEYSGFNIILTHFQDGYCESYEISCDNGRCIDDSLRCNGYNPCGDYSDCDLDVGQIAGIVVGGAVFVIIIIVVVVVVLVRRRRRYNYVQTGAPVMPVAVTTTAYPGYAPQGYQQPMPPKYTPLPPHGAPPNMAANQTSGLLTSYPPPPAYSATT